MVKPLQVADEIAAFAALLKSEGVTSYLEIGSKFGGSLKVVANALPKGSRIVSLDLNVNGPRLQNCLSQLNGTGYDAWLIPLDSTLPEAVERAQGLGPYDAVFIDGDHRLPGVTADWHNYGAMGKIIAFHDTAWHRSQEWVGRRIYVPDLWNGIKNDFRHQEIHLCPTGENYGIGVLWK